MRRRLRIPPHSGKTLFQGVKFPIGGGDGALGCSFLGVIQEAADLPHYGTII
jgi:hypothetical protein